MDRHELTTSGENESAATPSPPFGAKKAAEHKSPVLEAVNVVKSYGANTVLKGVSLDLAEGEVVGLLGANGAGKSTLIKGIVGAIEVDAGEMRVGGVDVELLTHSTRTAGDLGIHCVYQEPSVCSNLAVFENFSLLQRRRGRRWRAASKQAARAAIRAIFPDPGFPVEAEVSQLSLAQQQMVEIAAAASQPNLRVLILDEPSSALSFRRTSELHQFLRRLATEGVAIVYVSHKIEDVQELASRLVILRDGVTVWEGHSGDTAVDEIITALGGQNVREVEEGPRFVRDEVEPLVRLSGLTSHGLRDVELRVHPGEIVGLAGLEGGGQQQVLREIFRPRLRTSRSVVKKTSVAYVTGNRELAGTFGLWNIANNIVISSLRRVSRFGVVDRKRSASMAQHWFERLRIQAQSTSTPISSLSGGNQQKALISRGLANEARLLLLDDPTRGVDIGTKQEIYKELENLRAEGRSALLYSTETAEFKLCDRVYVFRRGEVVAELRGSSNSPENIVGWSYAQEERKDGAGEEEAGGSDRLRVGARLLSVARSRSTLPVLLLAGVLAGNGILEPNTLSSSGLDALLNGALPLLLASAAQMLFIMVGDIDLGVGTAIGLSNVISATLVVNHLILGLFVMSGMVLAYAAMGWLVEVWRMSALVVTLGASFVWLGIALIIQPEPGGNSPMWLSNALTAHLPTVPEPIYFAVGLAVLGSWFLRSGRFGVVWRAFGNKPRAVYQAGLSTTRTRVSLYALAGALVALSGLFTTAMNFGSDANGSTTYTLTTIAAVIVGGTQLSGGFVAPVGVVAGALAFALIPSLLLLMNVATAYETAVTGGILVAALALRRLLPSRAGLAVKGPTG